MLKTVSPLISPELMAILMRMGHGDEIVLADGNFPADACAQRIVRADGHGVPALLDAILKFFPLDTFVPDVAKVMMPVADVANSKPSEPAIWSDFRRLIRQHEGREIALQLVERFQFYEQARSAYAIVATGETAVYANLILKKGVVMG